MGQVIGDRYLLEELIASGGMGAVWRATDQKLGRVVAVKVMRPDLIDDGDFDARFRAEARTLAALNHPNVVRIHDYARCEIAGRDIAYLVMPYVHGQPLSERLAAAGRLSVTETMSVVAQAAEALHAVHELGVVHRDVKPANLLVQPDGRVVLVDFGVARSPAATSVDTGQTVLGSALYMAPEQASGRGVSPATDVYALGVVAYHCLAGRPPFSADSALETALKHAVDEPPPLPEDIPPAARQVVARAMDKDPAARYPSAAALGAAAAAAAGYAGAAGQVGRPAPVDATAVLATPAASPVQSAGADDTVPLAAVPPRRRRAALLGTALGVVLLALVALAFALRPAPPTGAGDPRQSAPVHLGFTPRTAATTPAAVRTRTNTSVPARTAGAGPVATPAAPATRASAATTGAPSRAPSPATGGSAAGAAGGSPQAPAARAAGPSH